MFLVPSGRSLYWNCQRWERVWAGYNPSMRSARVLGASFGLRPRTLQRQGMVAVPTGHISSCAHQQCSDFNMMLMLVCSFFPRKYSPGSLPCASDQFDKLFGAKQFCGVAAIAVLRTCARVEERCVQTSSLGQSKL